MNKSDRQDLILDLLRQEPVADQQQLLNLLRQRGEQVTQATLSRDLSALHVIRKAQKDGTYRYQVPNPTTTDQPQPVRLPMGVVMRVDYSANLVVLHTQAGYAQVVARELDERSGNILLGSVAGQDTVIAVVGEGHSRDTVRFLLHEIFG